MDKEMNGAPKSKKAAIDALLKTDTDYLISLDFVAAEAGDREMLLSERDVHNKLKQTMGERFYTELLLALTQQRYPPDAAEAVWEGILTHKLEMSNILGRNVGISVATLDYLSNICDKMDKVVVVPEERMVTVAEIALNDVLTGLYDRRTFNYKLREEILRFHRYGNEISLIMLDIDFFKKFNDTHGHVKGDSLLSELGEIIRYEIREVDIATRYGGEEFAVILPQTGIEEAYVVAERIRKHVYERFKREDHTTVSLGVAVCPGDGKTDRELVEAADKALYCSKQNGRNQTTRSSAFPH